MNDKELLELAAKAAGYEFSEWGSDYYSDGPYGDEVKHGLMIEGIAWNPLTDDGDALRLAVKLEIGALISSNFVYIKSYYDEKPTLREPLGNDPYVATRRAIVRAAAEIGKAMQ